MGKWPAVPSPSSPAVSMRVGCNALLTFLFNLFPYEPFQRRVIYHWPIPMFDLQLRFSKSVGLIKCPSLWENFCLGMLCLQRAWQKLSSHGSCNPGHLYGIIELYC